MIRAMETTCTSGNKVINWIYVNSTIMTEPTEGRISYEKLDPTRWEQFRELRLEALKSDSSAFGSEYEEELNYGKVVWQSRIGGVIFAISNNVPIGMMGQVYFTRKKEAHVMDIVGFFVKKEFRGMGIGTRLLEETIRAISENRNIRKIKLAVNSPQTVAASIYRKFGFEVVGTLKEEAFVDGKYLDQTIMEKFIRH